MGRNDLRQKLRNVGSPLVFRLLARARNLSLILCMRARGLTRWRRHTARSLVMLGETTVTAGRSAGTEH